MYDMEYLFNCLQSKEHVLTYVIGNVQICSVWYFRLLLFGKYLLYSIYCCGRVRNTGGSCLPIINV